MTSRWSLLTACLIAVPLAAPLAASLDPQLVKGKTTPAEAEDAFGMPIALSVGRDGALTLVYPASRFAGGTRGAAPAVVLASSTGTAISRVRLRFTADLTYDGYTLSGGAASVSMGLASK
jgi:hypothetical protein